MNRLLIFVGKKVLAATNEKILFSFSEEACSLEDWVSESFHARVLFKESYVSPRVDIVHISDVNDQEFKLLTIPKARKLLEAKGIEAQKISDLLHDKQSRNTVQLQYGSRDGRILLVSELKSEERGLNCNCICPSCGGALIARMGKKKQWHFAHKGDACNIAAAQQTAIHMLAKEIIEDNKRLLFPGISVKRDKYLDEFRDFRVKAGIPQSIEYRKPSVLVCDSVVLEKKISNIVPDIIITSKDHQCLIEVAVTHFVDEDKALKAREIGLPMMEIDLSDLYDTDCSRRELTEAVLRNPDNRAWIYNPLNEKAEERAKDEFSKLIHDEEMKISREDQKANLREEKKRQKREAGQKHIKDTFSPKNYREAAASLCDDQKAFQHLKKLHFEAKRESFPFFLNIPISGEMIFPCDRRIWQSKLFDKFVYNRNSEGDNVPTVHLKRVQKWIKDHNEFFPIDWSLTYKTVVSVDSCDQKEISLLYDVVAAFFNYLVYLGFLDHFSYQEAAVKQTHSLIPPDETHAKILFDTLREVDWYSPNVDNDISQRLPPETDKAGVIPLYGSKQIVYENEKAEYENVRVSREESYRVSATGSRIGHLTMIDMLFTVVYSIINKDVEEHISQTQSMLNRKMMGIR